MKVGVADYGMNAWTGARFDTEERLARLKQIGHEGLERCGAIGEADALHKAARFRRLGMDFATCRGPDIEASILWTAGLGKGYVWTDVSGGGGFRHLLPPGEPSGGALCPLGPARGPAQPPRLADGKPAGAGGVHDALPGVRAYPRHGHLAAAGGDPVAMARKYAGRLASVHLKDWVVLRPEVGLERWTERGRFCELGAGRIGLDNAAVVRPQKAAGYDGWAFVEQNTHLRDAYENRATSRECLRAAGL
ncbi:MAG: hypothetical protein QGI33_04340 [Candidatus Brocadiia bacterium]|jgi:hypothetical protein|nr:hypothetical protein [Candidatus Brocadiia bacterium]